ncbi:M48 family metallopeptidase [Rhodospirillaceae bacterium SYSU D60014]|uniref:M48 family metallopeptidase n=1 Tax=Virgifigura deserti TaxID=2268457 RepID=UPI0013C4EE21
MNGTPWTGYFLDGRAAERHAVTVAFGTSALEIADADGLPLATWPYAELRATERISAKRIRAGQVLRLARGEADEARLVLSEVLADDAPLDGSRLTELLTLAPQLASRSRLSRQAVRRFGLATAGFAAVAAALWFLWPPVADLTAGLVPRSWEDRLGRRLVEELLATGKVCNEPAGTEALDRLAARLTESLTPPHPVTVTVVDRAEINAFAAPGGHILLLSGLIETAGSAEEVAGVLAHEVGHTVERHGMRSMVRNLGAGLIFELLSGGSSLANVAPVLTMLAYSRDFEAEADARAVELLAAANIRTDGLADFFARLAREEEELPQVFAYLSTHPAAALRQIATARGSPAGGPAMTPEDWAALQGICGSAE